LVCSKQKDGLLRASVGYSPIMLGYWNGGAKRPTPLPLPLGRGVGTMKPRRGDITKDRVSTLSERHPTTQKRCKCDIIFRPYRAMGGVHT